MVTLAEKLRLGPDQFAFYFKSDEGIEAKDLATFLQRAATVARRHGAEIRVTGIDAGSLAVIMRALKKLGKAAVKEVKKAPIATTAVVAALIYEMAPSSGPTPMAKAAAEVVENHHVERIDVVTVNQTVIVMDPGRAQLVRQMERERRTPDDRPQLLPGPSEVRRLVDAAQHGELVGNVTTIRDRLYFSPYPYDFYVPMVFQLVNPEDEVYPDADFRVQGHLVTERGQPSRIVVFSIHAA